MRAAVASPGGSTEAGLEALEAARRRGARSRRPSTPRWSGCGAGCLPAEAIDRDDIADYVGALFLVYIILIFARILISFIPRLPYNRALRAVVDFVTEATDPYLNIFRRFLPPIGGGGFALDLSPMIGIIVLFIVAGAARRPDPG